MQEYDKKIVDNIIEMVRRRDTRDDGDLWDWTYHQYPTTPVLPKPAAKPAAKPAPAAVKPTPAPEPVTVRATFRLHHSKFSKNFLPAEIVYEMMRNQVIANKGKSITDDMLDWCEKNCSDLWMPSSSERPEYILFASKADMTLFLTKYAG